MLKVQIKEVYKGEVKPTETLMIEMDKSEVATEATSTVRDKIKILTDRMFDTSDKLQAFYVSVSEE